MTTYTTLNKIRSHGPCVSGWAKLLRHLGKTQADDEPLALTTILDSNGLDDALWCLRACDDIEKQARLYAVWCARQMQHLLTDPRSLAALDVAERYANGEATDAELAAAEAAARDAARDVAGAVAESVAWAVAWAAARAAGAAAGAARAASWAAAGAVARAAVRAAQAAEFRRRFG